MRLKRSPFYYLRHGQTDWNVEKLCIGQIDVALNENGIAQAKLVAPAVQSLDPSAIFHSPLERARLTASIVGEGTTLPLLVEPDLREVCLGIKEGQPENDPSDDFVSAWLAGSKIEGAETFCSFRDRVLMALTKCLSRSTAAPPLIVAHSGVYMALASACGFEMERIAHCRPYRFQPIEAGWSVTPYGTIEAGSLVTP